MKKVGEAEMNKTMFTRMAGALFSSGRCYAVYNTRDAVMKWSGMGEYKALHSLIELARLNAGISAVDSAILFGQSGETVLRTLLESDKTSGWSFDSIPFTATFILFRWTKADPAAALFPYRTGKRSSLNFYLSLRSDPMTEGF
ncbi:MAG: hypothetical protein ACLSB9_18785 [Hydrogeniiclostridium mannosilyticum]